MTAFDRDYGRFKRAVIISVAAHLTLFLLILLSPYFPKPSPKGMIHYVNVVSLPGGGGSGGGPAAAENIAETTIPRRETLKDLTTPQKMEETPSSSMRHPVEKPEKEPQPKKEKKAVIQKREKMRPSKSPKQETKGSGAGSGVRFGFGSGSGAGTGFQSPYSSQIGLSSFPYTYYLQVIIDRVSSNWFTSLVDPGTKGNFRTTVYFRILGDGRISSLKIEESSGLRSLDLSALRAVQTSSPFPPLPKEYKEKYLGIHLIFEHSK
jgi:TonB family protein